MTEPMTIAARVQIQSDGSTSHRRLATWVAEVAALTTPDRISWVTGSDQEWTTLTDRLVASGTFTRSVEEKDAGPTNNWMAPDQMKTVMNDLYRGSMTGRTMYVIPFVMGRLHADKPMFGVEITDSAYVAASMRVMTLCGTSVLRRIEELGADFVPALHSVGAPLQA